MVEMVSVIIVMGMVKENHYICGDRGACHQYDDGNCAGNLLCRNNYFHHHHADSNYCDKFYSCGERQVITNRFAKNI